MPFVVEEVIVEGFRGFREPVQIPYGRGLTIVTGTNGSGKSSALNAIAWALAGKQIAKKDLGPLQVPERKGWEVVHIEERRCRVDILLSDEAERMRIRRSSDRQGLSVERGGAAIDEDPLTTLGLTMDSLLSTVFLVQEATRAAISVEERLRERLFLELAGLGELQVLESALDSSLRAAEKAEERIVSTRRTVETRIAGQVSLKRVNLERLRGEAKGKGLRAEETRSEDASLFARRIREEVEALAVRYDLPAPTLPEVTGPSELGEFGRAGREALAAIEAAHPHARRHEERVRVQRAAATLRLEVHEHDVERKGADKERKSLAEGGSEPEIRAKLTETEEVLSATRAEITRAGAYQEMLVRALAYFATVSPGMPIDCPVCGRGGIDLAHVRAELGRQVDPVVVAPLRAREQVLEAEAAALKVTLRRWQALASAAERLSLREVQLRARAGELRGSPVEAAESLDRVVEAVISSAQEEIDELGRLLSERAEAIARVREAIGRLAIIQRIHEDEATLAGLDALTSDPAFVSLREEEFAAQLLLSLVRELGKRLREEKRQRFGERFTAVETEVERLYAALVGRADAPSLWIDPARWTVQAGREGEGREVTQFFNVGDLTGVAICLFLASARRARHDAGFVLLDEPAQNLDDEHKRRLAGILTELARERQVIVATADAVFLSELERAGTVERRTVRLRALAAGRGIATEEA